jgi:hypothetical protein
MAAGFDPGSDSDPKDPYSMLGVTPGAGFDDVQKARDRVVASCGDDAVARARVEAAYDAVLMERLRDRQSGRLSSAAASASQVERQQVSAGVPSSGNGPAALLTRLRGMSLPAPSLSGAGFMPDLQLVQGQGLVVRSIAGALALLLLLLAPQTVDLLLPLSTIAVFISQVKRGRRPLGSLGWTLLLLVVGLALGALLSAVTVQAGLPLGVEQWQALPTLLLLLAGALLFA